MSKWLASYEQRRHYNKQSKEPKESAEGWVSSKFDFGSGNWAELNGVFIPSLNMTVGRAISALKKSWKMYKHNLAEGEPTNEYAKRLLRLQSGLGLEQSEYLKSELMSMGYTEEELEETETEEEDLEGQKTT